MRHKNICLICGERYVGFGNSAMPINDGLCCDDCERFVVIPARVRSIMQREEVGTAPALPPRATVFSV